MSGRVASERFTAGDIIRYADGVSALFRYEGTHNQGRLYGSHVLGGAQGAADGMFSDLRPASAEDIEFCKARRPEWFTDENQHSPPETVSHAEQEILLLMAANVRERVSEGDGMWATCSGCHESQDGYSIGYPRSQVFGCTLGSGCSECGGIGAVWDTTDYGAMADELHAQMQDIAWRQANDNS